MFSEPKCFVIRTFFIYKLIYLLWFYSVRYQNVHNQSYIMVMASGRWLGVRLDLLASILIGAVSLAAVLVSQDAGRCICKVNQNRQERRY